MRMRLGFLAGLAAGYVLGAKAGTQRYVQIVDGVRKLGGTEPVQQITDELRVVTDMAGDKAAESVHKVTERIGASAGKGTSTGMGMTEGGTTPGATPPV